MKRPIRSKALFAAQLGYALGFTEVIGLFFNAPVLANAMQGILLAPFSRYLPRRTMLLLVAIVAADDLTINFPYFMTAVQAGVNAFGWIFTDWGAAILCGIIFYGSTLFTCLLFLGVGKIFLKMTKFDRRFQIKVER